MPWLASRVARSRPCSMALASSSATMCTTPERRPWVSGPPRRSMSTSSPVTERTTSGPVTKIRPSGARMTRSVRAGPYAAPPAAKPSTMEICGILPEAWVMAWKISPTACSDSTPSASRAPPECQMPRIGTRSCMARSYARTTTSQPCTPIAPPITVASEQKATTRLPLTVPVAASMPESSSGGDQLQRARVEQRLQPEVRVARVLVAGQLDLLVRGGCGGRGAAVRWWSYQAPVERSDSGARRTWRRHW